VNTHFIDPRCSWGTIFLYAYTGRITFGTIGSQGASPFEAEERQDGHSPDTTVDPQDSGRFRIPLSGAGPCSPKSIYRLAEKVRPALLGYVVAEMQQLQPKK